MTDNGEDFEKLRKLLALKRHEQPPPGYFSRLPDRITARIEAEESEAHSSVWGWLIARFDARPLLACTCGVAVSGLMLTGFHISQTLKVEEQAGFSPSGPWLASATDPLGLHTSATLQPQYRTAVEARTLSSFNPVYEPAAPSGPYHMAGFGIQQVSWTR